MTKYDASVLQTFADRLYQKAGVVTFQYVMIGLLIGAGLAAIPAVIISYQQDQAVNRLIEDRFRGTKSSPSQSDPYFTDSYFVVAHVHNPPFVICVIGGFFGGVVGGVIGIRKSFQYRLQAQLTLCQMQIEYNTHRD